MTERERLFGVHKLRMRAHWGKRYDATRNWPQDDKEWRAVEHGSPCDSNVEMARWHLRLAQQIADAGLLRTPPNNQDTPHG